VSDPSNTTNVSDAENASKNNSRAGELSGCMAAAPATAAAALVAGALAF